MFDGVAAATLPIPPKVIRPGDPVEVAHLLISCALK